MDVTVLKTIKVAVCPPKNDTIDFIEGEIIKDFDNFPDEFINRCLDNKYVEEIEAVKELSEEAKNVQVLLEGILKESSRKDGKKNILAWAKENMDFIPDSSKNTAKDLIGVIVAEFESRENG